MDSLRRRVLSFEARISLQDSKNEEYDKVLDFIKEFRINQTESQSSQNLEIETLKGIVYLNCNPKKKPEMTK